MSNSEYNSEMSTNVRRSSRKGSHKGGDEHSHASSAHTHTGKKKSHGGITIIGEVEDPKEYDLSRLIFKSILGFEFLIGALVFAILVGWILKFEDGKRGGFRWTFDKNKDLGGSINVHIVLMFFFMLYLHGFASLMYRILPALPKSAVKWIHAAVHFSVGIGTAVGLAAAVNAHDLRNQPHFYSLHSWIGITAIALYYVQFLGGFITFLLPIIPMNLQLIAIPFHRFIGQCLFSLASGAVVTGLMLKVIGILTFPGYQKFPPQAYLLNFAGLIGIIFAILVVFLLIDHRFRRRPRPEGV